MMSEILTDRKFQSTLMPDVETKLKVLVMFNVELISDVQL